MGVRPRGLRVEVKGKGGCSGFGDDGRRVPFASSAATVLPRDCHLLTGRRLPNIPCQTASWNILGFASCTLWTADLGTASALSALLRGLVDMRRHRAQKLGALGA
jgi:hypothetical protein